ncbi:ferredoxin domain-containing protein [Chloroflexota bacterium]
MTRYKSEKTEKDAVRTTAALMAASARTAPKARGVDATDSLVLEGDDLEELAAAMERRAEKKTPFRASMLKRDANNVRNSSCVLLIGVTGNPKGMEQPLDCGACGYEGCERLIQARKKKRTKEYTGPNCIFQALDLGIALGSAVKLASELGVDNRIMYTVGSTAKELRLLDSDVILGIPLSVTGKSPYFDR